MQKKRAKADQTATKIKFSRLLDSRWIEAFSFMHRVRGRVSHRAAQPPRPRITTTTAEHGRAQDRPATAPKTSEGGHVKRGSATVRMESMSNSSLRVVLESGGSFANFFKSIFRAVSPPVEKIPVNSFFKTL